MARWSIGLDLRLRASEVNVRAGGGNIWTNADAFHFVHRARAGDFDVAVQVSRLSRVNEVPRAAD